METRMCAYCRKSLGRKRFNGRLEDRGVFRRRKYCDRLCMARAMVLEEVTRGQYHRRARVFLGKKCERCQGVVNLQVHHRDLDWRNNDPANLETVCSTCHMKGHWRDQPEARRRPFAPCSVCGQQAKRKALCQKHLQRQEKYGDPHLTKRKRGSEMILVRVED